MRQWFFKRGKGDINQRNSTASTFPRDNVGIESSSKKTLPSVNKSPRAGPTEVWVSPSGRNNRSSGKTNVEDAVPTQEIKQGNAPRKTNEPAAVCPAQPWQEGASLTSTQNAAFLDAIDGIGNALSKKMSQDSIVCSIHELEQLLDQARPITRCEVLELREPRTRA